MCGLVGAITQETLDTSRLYERCKPVVVAALPACTVCEKSAAAKETSRA